MFSCKREKDATHVASLLAVVAFLYFAYYRVRFVGGCDSAAYLVDALRLRGIDTGLARDPALPFADVFVPLCMVGHDGVIHSIFPPGFSVLLALASVAKLEFFVTALCGSLGGLLLFFLARPNAGPRIALGTMVAWYAAPMTFWGSTQLMSDYVAACFVIGAMLAARRDRAFLAGMIVGVALGIRPTALLVLPAVAYVLHCEIRGRSLRSFLHLATGLALPVVGWELFFRSSFGTFKSPYVGNVHELTGENFGHQLLFLATETARQCWLATLFASLALVRRTRECLPYVLWFVPYLLLHSLWRVPYDAWWQLRFLGCALPALLMMAATGANGLEQGVRRARPRRRAGLRIAAILALGVYLWWSTSKSEAAWLRTQEFDSRYSQDVARIVEVVPRNALVGSFEHSTPLRLYGGLQSFQWCHPDAPALVRAGLAMHRSIYVVFLTDNDNGCPAQSRALRSELGEERIATLPSGARLIRLGAR